MLKIPLNTPTYQRLLSEKYAIFSRKAMREENKNIKKKRRIQCGFSMLMMILYGRLYEKIGEGTGILKYLKTAIVFFASNSDKKKFRGHLLQGYFPIITNCY